MKAAFGSARTIPASEQAKKIMAQLETKEVFAEQRDCWTLGASIGIALGKTHSEGSRSTFQNINSLDPEEIFAAIMLGLYPDLTPEERLKKLVDHAEAGIREIFRMEQLGSLDFSTIGTSDNSTL